MSISATTNETSAGQKERARPPDWQAILFWAAVLALIALAIGMRLYQLGLPFDRDSYDEGVYWQSLRSLGAGHALYGDIFYSQPPFFLLSTYPLYALFGASLWSARLGIVVVSLLALPGAFLLGKTLSGRLGALAALLLAVVDPLFLAQSQTIQAEASSVAFSFLAIGLAFYWWKYPTGWRGIVLAVLTGATVALSIMCKLLGVSLLVPVVMLMLARLWLALRQGRNGDQGGGQPHLQDDGHDDQGGDKHHMQRGENSDQGGGQPSPYPTRDETSASYRVRAGLAPARVRRPYIPIAAGILAFSLTMIVLVLPFLDSFQAMWSSVVTFHTEAGSVLSSNAQMGQSSNTFKLETALATLLTLAAFYGGVTALLRRDWRVVPLLGWLLATAFLLWRQVPLFPHHFVSLTPPLIGLAIMGIVAPLPIPQRTTNTNRTSSASVTAILSLLAIALILFTSLVDVGTDLAYYRTASARGVDGLAQLEARVAKDLDQAITPDQQVVTDAQFIAGLANRNTPPALVDTSMVRITTGSVTLAQLESIATQPQVHAVLFFTGRFGLPPVATFHAWVAQNFHLARNYGGGRELWVQ